MQNQILSTIELLTQNSILYLPRLLSAVAILFIGFKLQPIFNNSLKKFFDTHDYDVSLEKFLQSLLGTFYKIAIILFAISIAGIETASIVAALGAAGFAVGLALQGSMSNFASGILILSLKAIKVGEYIEISGETGTVHKIDIFNTVLLTPDNKMIIVPNSEITSKILVNYSRQTIRRVDLQIGVGYESNIKNVKTILEKIIKKHSESIILDENHNTIIRVSELGSSAVILSILVWCNKEDYLNLKSDLLEDIKQTLEKNKIDIPYQTLTINKFDK